MAQDVGRDLIECTLAEFRAYKRMAEKALAQVPDDRLHVALDAGSNSLAVIVRHVAGNLRSRFTDFLTADGEKPDRNRDAEFEEPPGDRAALLADWERGWSCLLGTLESLEPEHAAGTVLIRAEPHTVVKALQRSLAHTASHVGQIVFLAKHLASDHWTSLSIPRGQSEAFNARMRAKPGTRG